ncbi:hypothetical protein FBEOM_3622 [Fusarium beomiforme]|uniref:Uncharacterized protein n=1 Tax=Fusarium beomiforme TaxID=44412 RepID=A0A9P5APK8_9HYPO|nr:hypothetical protein FBEOM_3622 [Fusarium beomiforme]
MYISSRDEGTRALRQLKAREFHEMQWNENILRKGRLVGEKSIDLGELPKRRNTEKVPVQNEQNTYHHRLLSSRLISQEKINHVVHIFRSTDKEKGKSQPTPTADDHSIILTQDAFEPQFKPHVRDCEIPNANFARKFGLFTNDKPLPTVIRELPVAEDKAMDMASGSPTKGVIHSWRFHGPFTPQLWFDSGIDYRWKQISH